MNIILKAARIWLVVLVLGLIVDPGTAHAEDPAVAQAQRLFKQYVEMEHAFDPDQADLYAATATIKNTRIYPSGESRSITYQGTDFKRLVKAAMPVAKIRRDTSTYSNVTYSKEGQNVRIKCRRFSNLKQYSSPLELLVGPANGGFKILEETSESRP